MVPISAGQFSDTVNDIMGPLSYHLRQLLVTGNVSPGQATTRRCVWMGSPATSTGKTANSTVGSACCSCYAKADATGVLEAHAMSTVLNALIVTR